MESNCSKLIDGYYYTTIQRVMIKHVIHDTNHYVVPKRMQLQTHVHMFLMTRPVCHGLQNNVDESLVEIPQTTL